MVALCSTIHHGELELIIGVRRDPQFGQVLIAGAGGTEAELLDEGAITLVPADQNGVTEMLRGSKLWRFLDGWRGRPRLDTAADAASRLSWLAHDLGGGWPRHATMVLETDQFIIALSDRYPFVEVDAAFCNRRMQQQ